MEMACRSRADGGYCLTADQGSLVHWEPTILSPPSYKQPSPSASSFSGSPLSEEQQEEDGGQNQNELPPPAIGSCWLLLRPLQGCPASHPARPDGHWPAPCSPPSLSSSLQPSLGVAKSSQALLYVILCPVGAYFATGSFSPVSLLADPRFVRAWMGGVGDFKLGGNYGPTIYVQNEAAKEGCQQVLWLYGDDHQITEVGTMNIFVFWKDQQGDLELVTPPLNGIILPGVIRQSLLDLARKWGEFKVSEKVFTMAELIKGLEENRVKEMFGAGTACVVCPVNKIFYQGKNYHIPTMENGPEITKRFLKELTDIQYGHVASDWVYPV